MSAMCNHLLHPTWNADCKADNVTTCHHQPKGSHGTCPAVVVVAADVADADANDAVARRWALHPSDQWNQYQIRRHQNSAYAVETFDLKFKKKKKKKKKFQIEMIFIPSFTCRQKAGGTKFYCC